MTDRSWDLTRLRDDVGYFAEAIGRPLAGFQEQALALATLITVLLAPRQGGKSRTLAVLSLWWAYRKPGQLVLLVSAGEVASRRLLADIRSITASSPLLAGSVEDDNAGVVKLSTGSEIRSAPASERAIRGWSVDLLIVDEAIRVPDDVITSAAMPTVAARPDARIVMADVAGPAEGTFFDHAEDGRKRGGDRVRTFSWKTEDCGWITPSFLQAMRESMSALRFAAEFECRFAGQADALFTRSMLQAVTADFRLLELEELVGPARFFAGVDWGERFDLSALVAVGRLPQAGEARFGVACAHTWPAGTPLVGPEGVPTRIASAGASLDWLTAESSGLGGPTCQELWMRLDALGGGTAVGPGGYVVDLPSVGTSFEVRRRLDPSQGSKAAMYGAMRSLIAREQLLIPTAAGGLWNELLMLRVDLTASGGERIEARRGHDDLADALGLALGPYRSRRGEWRCRVYDLIADERSHGDDLRGGLPPGRPPVVDDAQRVSTPGGISLPRDPAWQSVEGSEVSVRGRLVSVEERQREVALVGNPNQWR